MDMGCGLGVAVGLGVGLALGRVAVVADATVDGAATLGLDGLFWASGAVVGPPALQAVTSRATGSTWSDFTQPVLSRPFRPVIKL